jgi:predicted Zn-dependent protease
MRKGTLLSWLKLSADLAPNGSEGPRPPAEMSGQRKSPPRPVRFARAAIGFGLVGACLVCWGCRTTPVSGRQQLVLVPEAEEMQLGVTAYQDVLKKEPASKNAKYVELVKRVGQRIAAVAKRDDFEWEFNVIQSDTQNAFCLPGGKVAVYEGIIPVCESEAGLAVVMSHEIAHALARHGGERMTQQKIKNAGGQLADYVLKDQDESKKKIALAAYGAASEYGFILPYSRTHESEADQIGLKLMAEAGYDPSEAPKFWERFSAAKSGQEQPEWLSTHPSDARRASELRAALPDAIKVYDGAKTKFGLGDRIVALDSTNIPEPPLTVRR